MLNNFFDLSKKDRAGVINAAAIGLGIAAPVIEKDIWLCLVLERLFTLPHNMAFKGGTSLSKIYNLIDRFSEDVDVTIDYRNFIDPTIPLANLGRTALNKLSEQLKQFVKQCVHENVFPYLNSYFSEKLPSEQLTLTVNENGEELRVHYPSALMESASYLQSNILIEFGGRNSSEPQKKHKVTTLLSNVVDDLILPTAEVDVLSPLRTFWEKATLMHVECYRGRLAATPERLSRHWYDLSRLADSWVGAEALSNLELLKEVIQHKTAFFNASYANYGYCLTGQFKLIPDGQGLKGLQSDYQKMQDFGMFSHKPPDFEEIIASVEVLEKKINHEIPGEIKS